MMNQTAAGISVTLRDIHASDLPILFEHHLDKEANNMAAFTPKDPTDRDAFMKHWGDLLADDSIIIQTIVADRQVAGYILSFEISGQREVGYWLGKAHWGKGIATQALLLFLQMITTRPLYAHAAQDNAGSIRVLQKCGFRIIAEGVGFSNARNTDVAEFILLLE